VEGTPSAFDLTFRSFIVFFKMENPLIAGFVEIQHEARTWAWSGKTTEDQASSSDCHTTAEIIFDEDFS
jgi:hypothetical protein